MEGDVENTNSSSSPKKKNSVARDVKIKTRMITVRRRYKNDLTSHTITDKNKPIEKEYGYSKEIY